MKGSRDIRVMYHFVFIFYPETDSVVIKKFSSTEEARKFYDECREAFIRDGYNCDSHYEKLTSIVTAAIRSMYGPRTDRRLGSQPRQGRYVIGQKEKERRINI